MAYPRIASETNIYHIIARGTGKQLIFEDDGDRMAFLGLMTSLLKKSRVELYAWCLMGNHVHLILHGDLPEVSRFMQRLLGTYAHIFNEKTGRVGHLFQERFKSQAIEDDEQLLTVLAYIHHNPVAAGLDAYDTYRWSSYREYLEEPGLCSTDFILSLFANPEEYRRLHASFRDDPGIMDVDRLRSMTRAMPDKLAIPIAQETLGSVTLADLKGLGKRQRDEYLVRLKEVGLSAKQVERLTGISKSVVQRAAHAV